jgi:Uma2 family endonuclease
MIATKSLLTCEDYAALQEPEGVRYELSEGELIVTPPANYFHNELRDHLNARLRGWVESKGLGGVTSETNVKLVGETVRRPDVAFIRAGFSLRIEEIFLASVPDARIREERHDATRR